MHGSVEVLKDSSRIKQLSKMAGMKRCCWRKRGYPILGYGYKHEERLEFFAPPPLILPQ